MAGWPARRPRSSDDNVVYMHDAAPHSTIDFPAGLLQLGDIDARITLTDKASGRTFTGTLVSITHVQGWTTLTVNTGENDEVLYARLPADATVSMH
jgi:hypothetical protein